MKIINVIERITDGNINVESFLVTEELSKKIVGEAEKLFSKKAKENGAQEENLDIYIEDGYYGIGTYELYLVWSN